MTKKFVTRALILTGLILGSASATFAQSYVSTVRRVAPSQEQMQPVAASTVIMKSSLNLSAEQRAKIAEMNSEVAALQEERARLWAEYRALKARPDFDDKMAETQAAPRMHRIVAINAQLEPMVARQEAQVSALLNASQRSQLAKLVTSAKAQL